MCFGAQSRTSPRTKFTTHLELPREICRDAVQSTGIQSCLYCSRIVP